VLVDDATRPDYIFDKIDARSTEGRFIKLLQDMKTNAELKSQRAVSENENVLTPKNIEDALYYGLDALSQKQVALPDVD
jgi:hypothetical protein